MDTITSTGRRSAFHPRQQLARHLQAETAALRLGFQRGDTLAVQLLLRLLLGHDFRRSGRQRRPSITSLGFTGEYTDPSGLLYLRARYMNPATATFLTKDPFAGYLHLVMSRNGYSYVHGNPVNFTDPTGEFVWFAALPLAGKVVVAGATALTGVLATLWIVNQMPSVEELQRFCDNIGQNFHPSNIPGNLRRAMQHFPPMRIFPGVWLDFSGSSSQVQTDTLIVEARITPRSGRDWNYLARKLGIDRNTLRENLHSCKEWAGVRGDQNVQVDDESGDIYYRGEYIGNIVDGC